MKLKLTALLFFCVLCNFGYAQMTNAEGVIKDAQSHRPIPFATLGIKGKNIGTVADENGVFHFSMDAGLVGADELIVISSVGYVAASVPVAKFKQGQQEVSLTPSSITLKAVTIKPDKYKTKVIGRTGSSTIMTANMFTEQNLISDNLGKEQAAILAIDKHCYLRDFNMLVIFNRFQNVKFRLNFYSVKDGQPDQLIVNKNILFDVTQRNGWQKVDLKPYNIYLDGYKEIAVAIQWVKSIKTDTIARSSFGVSVTPVPFHAMYFRNKSQANWKKISPAYVAFNLTVDSFKPDKEKDSEEAVQPEAAPIISDSLKAYAAYAEFEQQADVSGYGSNNVAGKYIHLPDGNLYYEVYGTGQPLLLLHGNGASISSFYKQIPELAKSYQVIAVDTRAQGKSTDRTTLPFTCEKFAQDMKLLMDSLQIKQANVVGWSDGGNIGLIMAAKYPTYVSKLVTVGAVMSPEGVEPGLLNQFKTSMNKAGQTSDNATTTRQRLLTLLVSEPHITDNELESIKVPVLVIAGEKDIVKRKHTQEISDHIKRSKLLILKDATHYAPQEKPVEFNRAVLEFLK